MKNYLSLLLILSVLIFSFCKNKNQSDKTNQKVDHSAAIPDNSVSVEGQLTEIEKNSLESPIKKSAEYITLNDLDRMFEHSEDQLHIYSFWKTDDLNCKIVNEGLLNIQKEVGDSTLRLIFVNIDKEKQPMKVNQFLREHRVTSNVFITSDSLSNKWYSHINNTWTGKVPAIYLKNNTDGTDLFYRKNFSTEELNVLVQPFIL